jgi:hypothetical protein
MAEAPTTGPTGAEKAANALGRGTGTVGRAAASVVGGVARFATRTIISDLVPGALGKGPVFSHHQGLFHWGDKDDKAGSNELGVKDIYQGIALRTRGGMGRMYDLTTPDGRTFMTR